MLFNRIIHTGLRYRINSTISFNQARKMAKVLKPTCYIGTHDGTFHCDDVTACFMLKQLDRFRDHEIIRTRDAETLANSEIVVDVGGELNVEKLRLDHHQRTFNQTIHDYHPSLRTTNPKKPPRLSSAGLVYAIFGHELIRKILKLENNSEESKRMVDAIYEKSYVEFFEEIDAIDNGVETVSGDNLVYNYHINSGLSNRVARLNPPSPKASPETRLEHFHKAMEVVGAEIIEGINFLGHMWWPQQLQFERYVLNRHQFDSSGQIVFIDDGQLIGWKSALVNLEEKLGIVGELKFIVYYDGSDASPWRATCMPYSLKSFLCRVPLKEEWRGKRDEELQEASGIPDATFVHMSGFTGGAKSEAGIKALVRKTLGLEDTNDVSGDKL